MLLNKLFKYFTDAKWQCAKIAFPLFLVGAEQENCLRNLSLLLNLHILPPNKCKSCFIWNNPVIVSSGDLYQFQSFNGSSHSQGKLEKLALVGVWLLYFENWGNIWGCFVFQRLSSDVSQLSWSISKQQLNDWRLLGLKPLQLWGNAQLLVGFRFLCFFVRLVKHYPSLYTQSWSLEDLRSI